MGGFTRAFIDDLSVGSGSEGKLEEGCWRVILEDEGFARKVIGRDDGANHNSRLPRFPVSPTTHRKFVMGSFRKLCSSIFCPLIGGIF